MGTIKKGILGGFSGTVGTVVGGNWKGIDYMRSKGTPTNPNTPAQKVQRTKFALTQAFLKPITSYVRIGFRTYAIKKTAYNCAMSHFIKNCITGESPNFTIDFTKVVLASGNLPMPSDASFSLENGVMTFSWTDNSVVGDARQNDFAMPLIYNKNKGEAIFSTESATRSTETIALPVSIDWAGDELEMYLSFSATDSNKLSNSEYLGSYTIPAEEVPV